MSCALNFFHNDFVISLTSLLCRFMRWKH